MKTVHHKIPLAAKAAGAAFLAVLAPVYWQTYGPSNFLWFCDTALVLTVAGMWLESSLLISMCAVGILLPQCLWLADFGGQLLGIHVLGLTGYMFDQRLPLFTRGLSLFHGWLGGQIGLESEPGKGTKFWIQLEHAQTPNSKLSIQTLAAV